MHDARQLVSIPTAHFTARKPLARFAGRVRFAPRKRGGLWRWVDLLVHCERTRLPRRLHDSPSQAGHIHAGGLEA